jgi:signal peptidase II
MVARSSRWLFSCLAVCGVVVDQVSKYGVFRWLYNDGRGGQFEVVPGGFELIARFSGQTEPAPHTLLGWLRTWSGEVLPQVNNGALFGLGNGEGGGSNWLFSLISVAAAVAIVWWSTRRSMARDRFLCAALGLILAGTVGNLYDRVVFAGVRDFLHYYYLFEWPVFNAADCCLVCGAALLLLQAFLSRPPATEPSDAANAKAPQDREANLSV